jgi:hypothetical protein
MKTKASIIDQESGGRVHLHIVDDGEDRGDCRYQWHRADGESIEVSGATEAEATAALRTAYADDCWRLIVVDHVTARAAAAFGRMGGSVGSPAQRANSRRTDRGGGRPPKMRLTVDDVGRVIIEYRDWTDLRRTRRFTCPSDGGYVVELLPSGDTTQVCDLLAHRGPTLISASRDALPDLIRREYRKMRRSILSERDQ